MVPKEEKEGWHYLEVKKLSALLRRIRNLQSGPIAIYYVLHSNLFYTQLASAFVS